MKLSVAIVPLAIMLAASAASALPGNGRASGSEYLPANHGSANATAGSPQNLKNAIGLLRAEALKMQTDDGGTLTASHRTYLQTKFDRITGRRIGLRDL